MSAVFDVTAAPFNAIADGATDNSPRIQAAIDAAAPQRGAEVFIPPGASFYRCNTPLRITQPGLTLRGAGCDSHSTSRLAFSGTDGLVITPPDADISTHYIRVHDLCLGGTTVGRGITTGLTAAGPKFVDEIWLERVHTTGFDMGMEMRRWSNSKITACTVEGARLGFVTGGNCNADLVEDSWFGECSETCVVLDSTTNGLRFHVVEGGIAPRFAWMHGGALVSWTSGNIEQVVKGIEIGNNCRVDLRNLRFLADPVAHPEMIAVESLWYSSFLNLHYCEAGNINHNALARVHRRLISGVRHTHGFTNPQQVDVIDYNGSVVASLGKIESETWIEGDQPEAVEKRRGTRFMTLGATDKSWIVRKNGASWENHCYDLS